VLGVQWHPEADERSRVITALVDAAAQYAGDRRRDADRPAVQAVPDPGYRTASGSA
jgi:hypothetical protein